jgi:SET domain-containing protein
MEKINKIEKGFINLIAEYSYLRLEKNKADNEIIKLQNVITELQNDKNRLITPFSLKNGTLFDLYNKKYLLL